jgi:DNA polymerase I-like protein with 3'-5' exonuclease and polymerase domains
VRASVEADPGFLGVDADFEGCEIRVAAGLSGDQQLLEAEVSPKCYACDSNPCRCEREHHGLHWMAAHAAFGPDATKEHRYWCKRGIFCKLFGGGYETAAAQVYCDVEPMQRIFSAFEELAPVYTEWDKWLRHCYYEGQMVWRDYSTGQNYSQDIEGKRRGIYRTYSGRNIYVTAPHAFGNYAIQGTARELLVDGIIRWSQGPWGQYALLPIHDEILTWVPQADSQRAVDYLVQCMQTDVLSSPGFPVHIGADPSPTFTAWPDSS